MLFSAWIMFFFWDFCLPATLTISVSPSWLVSPEAEEPSSSLRAWEGQPEVVVARTIPVAEARLPQVGLSHHVIQTCQAVKPFRGLEAHCQGWEGPRGAHWEQQHPLSPAQSWPGCAALPPQDNSFAWRIISSLQNSLEGCELP